MSESEKAEGIVTTDTKLEGASAPETALPYDDLIATPQGCLAPSTTVLNEWGGAATMPHPWNHTRGTEFRYGNDDLAYEIGMRWLAEAPGTIYDWGCGAAYARKFAPEGRYIGIDGWPACADIIADLVEWQRPCASIFMRGVLEHNRDGWRRILTNAIRAFRERFFLSIHTPIDHIAIGNNSPKLPEPELLRTNSNGAPDLKFLIRHITDPITDAGLRFRFEAVETKTEYGGETFFWITH